MSCFLPGFDICADEAISLETFAPGSGEIFWNIFHTALL